MLGGIFITQGGKEPWAEAFPPVKSPDFVPSGLRSRACGCSDRQIRGGGEAAANIAPYGPVSEE